MFPIEGVLCGSLSGGAGWVGKATGLEPDSKKHGSQDFCEICHCQGRLYACLVH